MSHWKCRTRKHYWDGIPAWKDVCLCGAKRLELKRVEDGQDSRSGLMIQHLEFIEVDNK